MPVLVDRIEIEKIIEVFIFVFFSNGHKQRTFVALYPSMLLLSVFLIHPELGICSPIDSDNEQAGSSRRTKETSDFIPAKKIHKVTSYIGLHQSCTITDLNQVLEFMNFLDINHPFDPRRIGSLIGSEKVGSEVTKVDETREYVYWPINQFLKRVDLYQARTPSSVTGFVELSFDPFSTMSPKLKDFEKLFGKSYTINVPTNAIRAMYGSTYTYKRDWGSLSITVGSESNISEVKFVENDFTWKMPEL